MQINQKGLVKNNLLANSPDLPFNRYLVRSPLSRSLRYVLLISAITFSSPAKSIEFVNGFGFGIQYGGVIGWQGALVGERNRTRISFGFAGLAIGYDYRALSRVSFGAQAFLNQYRYGGAVSLNYYLQPNSFEGLVIGLDVFRGYNTVEGYLDAFEGLINFSDAFGETDIINPEVQNGAFLSLGYHF